MAEAELRQLEERLGAEGLARALGEVLAAAPDPDSARLVAALGVAPFLARHLAADPAWVLALAEDDLARPRSADELAAGAEAALAHAGAGEEARALRRFKYRELARWCAREASPELAPESRVGEGLRELSHLADALLSRAFACAQARLAARVGPPRWRRPDGSEYALRFAVLGLGKLGGEELNFSSDVDLVYVVDGAGEDTVHLEGGPEGLAPEAYAGRLAAEFGRLVSEATAEGFLYRIDLDLRPEGALGTLLVSADVLSGYYDGWAAVWEKAAFTKARPVAGDLRFGWSVVRRVHPMVYRSAMDFAGVEAIKSLKERIERERGAGAELDVKLGAGGIRDVEFVAQALQLLHGGRVPQLRTRSTQEALASLAGVGLLASADAEALLSAYRFLRRVENRLQMEGERQVHAIPASEVARGRLARAVGFAGPDGLAAFDGTLAAHRRAVRERFEHLLAERGEERVLALFARGAPRLLHVPATRAMVEDLARHFARAIEAAADPGLALNNLDRFIQGIGNRSFYYGLLLDRPELVPRLAALFGASKYLSGLFASHPDLIEPVFSDPDVLLLSRAELERDLAGIRARLETSARDPVERGLAALRLFHHRQLVNVALLDLSGKIGRRDAERALSEIAETCAVGALELAREQLAGRGLAEPVGGAFLVVGMGKLGSRELVYGSDLDVIFLYDLPGADENALAEAQDRYVRLAQKWIGALDTRTAEGFCYAVDARLRPSGHQGPLVTSLGSFRQHHEHSAMSWERQALLRARPIAGSDALGRAFDAQRREILARPVPPDLGAEIHRIRMRVESELAHEGGGRRDLKTGRGGLVDVESVVQYLQLRRGREHPALFDPESIETQLGRCEELGLLDAASARVLREGWEFLQRLSSRLRVVQNRSISDLREDRADLDSVARALGYAPSSRTGDARRPLLEDYRRHTEAIRQVYLRVLGVAGGSA